VVVDLILIGLGIALQPFRVSAFILILSTKGGTRKGLGFILGWLACLVLVIAVVLLVTGGRPVRFRTFPSTAVLIVKLALGIALIVAAMLEWRRKGRPRAQPAWMARLDTMSPWTAALIAVILQPWTLVAAGAVPDRVFRTELNLFCFFLVLCMLAALRTWLDEHGGQVIIVLCLAIGLWLAGQSIHLLTETGRGAVEHCGGRPAC